MIYADNAATTKLDKDAFDAMCPYLMDLYGNSSQPYTFAHGSQRALKEARAKIAKCINAHPNEIFFTSGGTESDNWAIKGMLEYNDYRGIITSEFEHHAILRACDYIKEFGVEVNYLHPTKNGFIQPKSLNEVITNDTKLVSVMTVNNEIGTIQPIKELCEIAHKHNVLFHTDAVQAVGHIIIDVRDLDVDLLSCSAHKYNGPKGIGFLYIREGTKIHSYVAGGVQEFGKRAGTENIASIIGMSIALEKNCKNINENQNHLAKLEEKLLSILNAANIDFIRNGKGLHVPGNINLSFRGYEGEMLLHRLDLMGIMVSTGSACDSVSTQVSHVLQAIDVPDEYAIGTIRISLGKENTFDEVRCIAESIIKILN